MEAWLLASDAVCKELALKEIPDHSTLNRTYPRMRVKLLDTLQRTLLDELQPSETGIAFDTTGYSPTQASLHDLARCGRQYDRFDKGGYAVGIDRQLILAAVSGMGPGADTGFLEPLRRKARRYRRRQAGIVRWGWPDLTQAFSVTIAALAAAPLALALLWNRLGGFKAFGFEIMLTPPSARMEPEVAEAVGEITGDQAFNSSSLQYIVGRITQVIARPEQEVLELNLYDGKYWWSTRLFLLAA